MMGNNIDYKIYKFYDYNDDFFKKVKIKGSNKVYILDIQVREKSGIDIARTIRETDLQSALIFLTSHGELAEYVVYNVISTDCTVFAFIPPRIIPILLMRKGDSHESKDIVHIINDTVYRAVTWLRDEHSHRG